MNGALIAAGIFLVIFGTLHIGNFVLSENTVLAWVLGFVIALVIVVLGLFFGSLLLKTKKDRLKRSVTLEKFFMILFFISAGVFLIYFIKHTFIDVKETYQYDINVFTGKLYEKTIYHFTNQYTLGGVSAILAFFNFGGLVRCKINNYDIQISQTSSVHSPAAKQSINQYNRTVNTSSLPNKTPNLLSKINNNAFFAECRLGSVVSFGKYYINKPSIKEPIEWIILAKENGNILLISKYALDCQKFNEVKVDTLWDNSSLRKWLNEEFFNNAFNPYEQNRINNSEIHSDLHPADNSPLWTNTTDRIFILNKEEAEKYFRSNNERKCVPTAYAASVGAPLGQKDNPEYLVDGKQVCRWWLRTPKIFYFSQTNHYSIMSSFSSIVDLDGSASADWSIESGAAVRPAMWFKLIDD